MEAESSYFEAGLEALKGALIVETELVNFAVRFQGAAQHVFELNDSALLLLSCARSHGDMESVAED